MSSSPCFSAAAHRGGWRALRFCAVLFPFVALAAPTLHAQATPVVDAASRRSGSVEGTLVRSDTGKTATDVTVTVLQTGVAVNVDKTGHYKLTDLAPGTYTLVASGEGYRRLRITDVVVKPGTDTTLSIQDMPTVAKEGEVQTMEEVVVSAKKDIETMEKYIVEDTKPKPFTDRNVDIPRGIDDVQPYYIFDAKTIEQSGATNIEDFLKARLTMNQVAQTNGQGGGANQLGNLSTINLRGLGADHTLILIDGRRMAGVTVAQGANYQSDVNGVPISAIDRIEILPSSASGIYGGSAIGGVVNIILKKDFSGGEIGLNYANTWDTDSPNRSVSFTYGTKLEGGKTSFMISAQASDAKPLVSGDRISLYKTGSNIVLANNPDLILQAGVPLFGATPNIIRLGAGNLVLKNGVTLTSNITFIPAGTSPSTSASDLYAALAANSGQYNLAPAPTASGGSNTLFTPLGSAPRTKSLTARVSREMTPNLEVFLEYTYAGNHSSGIYNPYSTSGQAVLATTPTNPFTSNIRITTPNTLAPPVTTDSINTVATLGLLAKLPFDWKSEFDYTHSENRFAYSYANISSQFTTDIRSGAINPFVDMVEYPQTVSKYLSAQFSSSANQLDDFALRGFGSLFELPWGNPTLAVGLEHRINTIPLNTLDQFDPLVPSTDVVYTTFKSRQITDSVYLELDVPLVRRDKIPLVKSLELQVAERGERYTVDGGTLGYQQFLDPSRAANSGYLGTTLNGQPFTSKTTYTSKDSTLGIKYEPIRDFTVRASYATAFLPPAPTDLIPNPLPDAYQPEITDPKTGQTYNVTTVSGGNRNLVPQTSKSWNVGVIYEPTRGKLNGLRLDAEYYKIDQFNAITSLDAQTILGLESMFPGRVTRDSTGLITQVDVSSLNLYKMETEGWDLSADYRLQTGLGVFMLHAGESIILHLKTQYSLTVPEYDAVNFPSENGALKYKTNATLNWEWSNWTAGWTITRYSAYKQYGAAGGPAYAQADGAPYTGYILAQGSDTVPSQTYHDLFVGYSFDKNGVTSEAKRKTWSQRFTTGLTIQAGIQNIFDKAPPFDAYYGYFTSPYGDKRLRSYWVNVRKQF